MAILASLYMYFFWKCLLPSLCPLPTVPDVPRNVCTLLTYQKSDGDDPGQLARIALDWTPVVCKRLAKFRICVAHFARAISRLHRALAQPRELALALLAGELEATS